jgi:bifunctional ADP-heptose synthase (sugar kinase/adenylyltransferase)
VDTRTKVLGPGAAREAAARARREGKRVRLLTGYFDPLVAAHVRALEQAADGAVLFAAVSDPPQPILPAAARAELVAALRGVDYVVAGGIIEADETIHREAEDECLTRELIRHVHSRQSAR